jgi:hypothetical protein
MHINAENNNEIVIEDLDDTHLLIKESKIYDLKRLLDLVRRPPRSPPTWLLLTLHTETQGDAQGRGAFG